MELYSIFANHIWSIGYDGHEKDVLTELFENWIDILYLSEYFDKNEYLLNNSFWCGYTKEELINETFNEAITFNNYLYDLYVNCQNGTIPDFDDLFKKLSPNENVWTLEKEKAYSIPIIKHHPSMLRLYAIKIQSNAYVITGGGIKLVEKMQETEDLRIELQRLQATRNWLKYHDVDEVSDLKELENT